jgi:endonuclease III
VCDAKKPRCSECALEDLCPASLLPRTRQRKLNSTT